MMTTIRQILAKKPAVYSTSPQATVYDALETMADKNVGALLARGSRPARGASASSSSRSPSSSSTLPAAGEPTARRRLVALRQD